MAELPASVLQLRTSKCRFFAPDRKISLVSLVSLVWRSHYCREAAMDCGMSGSRYVGRCRRRLQAPNAGVRSGAGDCSLEFRVRVRTWLLRRACWRDDLKSGRAARERLATPLNAARLARTRVRSMRDSSPSVKPGQAQSEEVRTNPAWQRASVGSHWIHQADQEERS